MEQHGSIDGLMRFLRGIVALGLAVASGSGVILVLEGTGPEPVSVMAGRGPGVVVVLAADAVGDAPFTTPFAVDLGLDPALLALAPRSAAAVASPHHRHSSADRIFANELIHALAATDLDPGHLSNARIERIINDIAGLRVIVSDLEDGDGNRIDDDGRFTVTALDGSAVCVTLGARRGLLRSLGVAVDVDGVTTSGFSWSPDGPCSAAVVANRGSDIRVATTPGTYGGTVSGDVCDVSALAATLDADPALAEVWGSPRGRAADDIAGSRAVLPRVVLLPPTAPTDPELRGGGGAARQAILQRGTAVLVDPLGMPKVRCMSGAPLRAPQALPAGVGVIGETWPGFSVDEIRRIPAGDRVVKSFVLIDVRTGHALIKPAGVEGILARLAGPIATPAES